MKLSNRLKNLLLIGAVALPHSWMITAAAAAILVLIRPSRVKSLFTSRQIIFQIMVDETSQPHPFFSMTIITLSKTGWEPWDKYQCPICTILSWRRSIYFWHTVISECTESHWRLRQAQNSTQSMVWEWRGRGAVIYWCGPLRITVREDKESTNEHVAACEMEMKRFPEFLDWIRSHLSLTLAFCHVKRWLLAIKEQTHPGSKSVQINQYYIRWVLRSQSIPDQS